jgi:hypothetical protein
MHAVAYRERLVPGPGTVAACLLLLPAVLIVLVPFQVVVAVVSAVAVTALVVGALVAGAPVVAVSDGVLQAGRARIEVEQTGPAEPLRREAARAARGVDLDARAWLVLRGWVDGVVRVPVLDPDDPAPYWLVSTRHPEALVAALDAERRAAL